MFKYCCIEIYIPNKTYYAMKDELVKRCPYWKEGIFAEAIELMTNEYLDNHFLRNLLI